MEKQCACLVLAVGAKRAGKSIWDPDEFVQLLSVISVMVKAKNQNVWMPFSVSLRVPT